MRRLAVLLASLLLVVGSVARAHDAELQAELLDEILRLSHARVADDVILEQIAAWDFVFELSADDIVELRSLGVTDTVLAALIRTGSPQEDGALAAYAGTRVYVGAGYYSPWYYYPYAWGGYCDPFPRLYAAYYYPFQCSAPFGYYGWCGGTYYAHYQPRHWRRGLRYGGQPPGRPAPYTVAAGREARSATTVTVPRTRQAGPGEPTTQRILRSRAERTATAVRHAPVWRGPEQQRAARGAGAAATAYRRGATSLPAARERASRELRRATGSDFRAPAVRTARPASPSQSQLRWSNATVSRGFNPPRSSSFSRAAMPRSQPMARPAAPPASLSARFNGARAK